VQTNSNSIIFDKVAFIYKALVRSRLLIYRTKPTTKKRGKQKNKKVKKQIEYTVTVTSEHIRLFTF